jgi:hypothetical protein
MKNECANCRHFHGGYRLQGFKVPSSCNRHFHTVSASDPACEHHGRVNSEDSAR